MLTIEQQRFIHRYVENKGDFYKTVETMGVELNHIMSWQQTSDEFNREYRQAKQFIIDTLKQENYMTALLRVNQALNNGVNEFTVTNKHRIVGVNDAGEQLSEYEVVKTNKHVGVPSWAINAALKESSIVKAVNTLASEGVLPSNVARKILNAANKIGEEIKNSFDISPDSEYINDKKAISLIKQAILGSPNE